MPAATALVASASLEPPYCACIWMLVDIQERCEMRHARGEGATRARDKSAAKAYRAGLYVGRHEDDTSFLRAD